MILFSVVIPTYNDARDLDRCLASLVAQTYKNFEVIVCDDGSTDNTKEVAESYQGRLDLVYEWEKNWGGPARPRNRGIALARAEWICFLDQDDWWYPNKLEECALHLDQADIMYHDADAYDGISHKLLRRLHSRQLTDDPFTDLMLNGNALLGSSVVVKKSILERVGGMAEEKKLITFEDFDCWLKIAKITKKFLYLPESLGAYSMGAGLFRNIKHINSPEELWRRNVGGLRTAQEKELAAKIVWYNQARIYHANKRYGQALVLYWKAGPVILAGRLSKYFRTKFSPT
jgi:glycosyltransferase involved in cell wall biosynthesis